MEKIVIDLTRKDRQTIKKETIMDKITITLTREEYDILCRELSSLEGYHWNDDHIHANDCGSKILSTIEDQVSSQLK